MAQCFQLIHLLPDVASHLSWLETAHRAGILMTAALHPSSSSLPTAPHIISTPPPPASLYVFALHTLYILSAQLISCLPIFTPPCHDSFSPGAAALCQPNFCFLSAPPCVLYLASVSACHLCLSPAAQSITYHPHYQTPFHLALAHFNLCCKQFLFSSSLQHCPTSSPRLLVGFFFVFAHLVSAPPPLRLANFW